MKIYNDNEPEEQERSQYPMEVIVLATVMTVSILLSAQHIIENSTSIIISSLIIIYGVYGILRR